MLVLRAPWSAPTSPHLQLPTLISKTKLSQEC